MIETKADALEASFAGVEGAGAPAARPMLAGAAARPGGAAFEGFVRSGATLEMKAFTGTTGESGGYAVPSEIDRQIETLLRSASPIRAIANVVKVGR